VGEREETAVEGPRERERGRGREREREREREEREIFESVSILLSVASLQQLTRGCSAATASATTLSCGAARASQRESRHE
jgi:hypothetical protein